MYYGHCALERLCWVANTTVLSSMNGCMFLHSHYGLQKKNGYVTVVLGVFVILNTWNFYLSEGCYGQILFERLH